MKNWKERTLTTPENSTRGLGNHGANLKLTVRFFFWGSGCFVRWERCSPSLPDLPSGKVSTHMLCDLVAYCLTVCLLTFATGSDAAPVLSHLEHFFGATPFPCPETCHAMLLHIPKPSPCGLHAHKKTYYHGTWSVDPPP